MREKLDQLAFQKFHRMKPTPAKISSLCAKYGLHSSLLKSVGIGDGVAWVPSWNILWAASLEGVVMLPCRALVLGEYHPSPCTSSQSWRPPCFTRWPSPFMLNWNNFPPKLIWWCSACFHGSALLGCPDPNLLQDSIYTFFSCFLKEMNSRLHWFTYSLSKHRDKCEGGKGGLTLALCLESSQYQGGKLVGAIIEG